MSISLALAFLFPFLSAPHPPSGGTLHTLVGDAPGDRFGAALAGLGDLDGDGCADLAVGAPQADPNGDASGRVRFVSGRDASTLRVLDGAAPHDAFGSALAAVGDVDGDGVLDLLIGAPRGQPPSGSAWLVSGASGATIRIVAGASDGELFGASLCGLGDVDGDGVPDLAIGAPQSDAAGLNAGRVEIRSGASGLALREFTGATFDLFGTALADAGDVDGDGAADLWIGAPLSDAGAFNAGSAYLRSGADGSLLLAIHGSAIGDQLGQWIAAAGDADGDGRADVLVAVPGADANGIDSGAVELRSSASGALLLRVPGERSGLYLGAVAAAGDLDGDGRVELLVGAPAANGVGPEAGAAFVLSGARFGARRARLEGTRAYDWFGAALAGVGDLDGDGWPDLAIGAPVQDDVTSAPGSVRLVSGRHVLR